MNIASYKVKTIIYPNYEYRLSKAVRIIDEGSFYRIDTSYMIDKYKILSISLERDKLTIVMTDKRFY